jgi:acetyltransferase
MQPPPKGPNLAIITNAGGPGVMTTDALINRGGKLASLKTETVEKLDNILPSYWSKGNPIDICEDATVERFIKVLDTCLKDDTIDGYLVIYTPIGATDPIETTKALIEFSKKTTKPVLTSWLGEEAVQEARNLLRANMIPTFPTPKQAVAAFMYMYQYGRNLELLFETPEELPIDFLINRTRLEEIIKIGIKEGRNLLTEPESKEFLKAYKIPIAPTHVAKTPQEAVNLATKIGYPVVLKVLAPKVGHKTEVGGVFLNITSDSEVKRCFGEVVKRLKKHYPSAKVDGVTVQPMISGDYELMIGAKKDPQFGSVITFGMGGVGVELFKDISVGFPPLNQTLARMMIEKTKVFEHLSKGFRGKPPANLRLIEEILIKFAQLIIDFPQIKEVDVNPLLVDEKRAVALDARIILDTEKSKATPRYKHLIIRPYPKKYVKSFISREEKNVLLRPIRPEDEPFLVELFKTFSERTMRFRFFKAIKEISHKTLATYCNVDYDREIAIVAELTENGEKKIIGMVRLVVEADGESGEVAVVVGDPWQNKGIGTKMIEKIIEISRDMKLKRIFGEIISKNTKIIHILYKTSFEVKPIDKETCLATLSFENS